MSGRIGDPVTINLTTGNATTAGGTPVKLKDSTGATRVLGPNECLIVYSLQANVSQSVGGLDVFCVADSDATGDVILGSYATIAGGSLAFMTMFGPDGVGCPRGATPLVFATNVGGVTLVGSGYIKIDSQSPGRQSFESRLNP